MSSILEYVCFCVYLIQSGQEFHADLYPDTLGRTAAMSAAEWWKGGEKQVEKVSVNPSNRQKPNNAKPANQTAAKKELPSGRSKEEAPVRGCSTSSSSLSSPAAVLPRPAPLLHLWPLLRLPPQPQPECQSHQQHVG
ncbi:coronin-7-like [Oncorhynchus masou masou]|uniref:coronin-7-like n=1 Tax=Oncorhynchus masou masou TaxID=90313 RepID=UPI0031846563